MHYKSISQEKKVDITVRQGDVEKRGWLEQHSLGGAAQKEMSG